MKLVMDQCVKEAYATIDAQGPIEAALDLYHYCLLKDYYRLVRKNIDPPDDKLAELMFLTVKGGKFTNVIAHLQVFAAGQKIELPSATLFRKAILTEGAATLDDAQVR